MVNLEITALGDCEYGENKEIKMSFEFDSYVEATDFILLFHKNSTMKAHSYNLMLEE